MQAACKQTTGNYVLLKYLHSDDSPCENTVGLPLFARNTGQQNLTFFLAHEEKYLILIELLKLNSNV